MDAKRPPISALVLRVISTFKELISALSEDQTLNSRASAESHHARFKLWAGSLGAHRFSGYRSLEYRLRDASFIRAHVTSLLDDLYHSIDEGEPVSLISVVPSCLYSALTCLS